jgi:predicted nucleotidyltransferase
MILDNYKTPIFNFCKQNNVKTLSVFGSVLTEKFNAQSDIDMVVELLDSDPIQYAENYFNLKFSLQDLLNYPIDLLEDKALKNSYLKQKIATSKIVFYQR